MALDYNLYYNAELNGEQLIEQAAQALNLHYTNIENDEVLKFDMEEIGVRVFIANESVKKCKIKTNEFTFQKVIIFELRKTFLNDPFRRTALLKIVLYLIEKYTSESVFLFNGDSIIVVQAGKDILINTKDGFFHHGVAEVLNEVVYETQNYSEADFAPY